MPIIDNRARPFLHPLLSWNSFGQDLKPISGKPWRISKVSDKSTTGKAQQTRYNKEFLKISSIQTNIFWLSPTEAVSRGGGGEYSEAPLYNLKTAHDMATKITQNNVFFISNI